MHKHPRLPLFTRRGHKEIAQGGNLKDKRRVESNRVAKSHLAYASWRTQRLTESKQIAESVRVWPSGKAVLAENLSRRQIDLLGDQEKGSPEPVSRASSELQMDAPGRGGQKLAKMRSSVVDARYCQSEIALPRLNSDGMRTSSPICPWPRLGNKPIPSNSNLTSAHQGDTLSISSRSSFTRHV